MSVQSAPPSGQRKPLVASPSKSTGEKPSPIAGIADGASALGNLSSAAAEFWASRKISQRTLGLLGVDHGIEFFPDLGRKAECAKFHFRHGWKARALTDKSFRTNAGFKLDFWNIENVLRANPQRIYLTEGEGDSLALVEAGIDHRQVLSVPNGAVERREGQQESARGYEFVQRAIGEGLARVKQIIWCGDNDAPGLSLRADMAQIFGPARFYFVEWPEGCKDANDVLKSEGPRFLNDLVNSGALPWPVDGLYRLSEIPEMAPIATWSTGMAGWDRHVKLAPGMLSVATGHGGNGKTITMAQIFFNISKAYGVTCAVASFETRAKPHYRKILRALHAGAPEWKLCQEQIQDADAFINDRYLFLIHPEGRPTLEWFLDAAEVAVIRHGAKIVQLDPWNRLEASRSRNESETEYIGRCLRGLHSFAHDMNCHVQVVAHPAKMDAQRRNLAPDLDDIAASKNWSNMVDQGFTIHRPKIFDGTERRTAADFYHRKARFDELGYPCKLPMNYNLATARYEIVDPAKAAQKWDFSEED